MQNESFGGLNKKNIYMKIFDVDFIKYKAC